MRNCKKSVFWIVVGIFTICFAITGCKGSSSGALPEIHSHSYVVDEVSYESMIYSFTVIAGENSPVYTITEDMHIASEKEHSEEGIWTELGQLEEIRLTKENFDELFLTEGWVEGKTAKNIRKNTVNAWQLVYDQEVLYYVLQQKNGDLYLAYGYYDYSEKNDPTSDDTSIRWLYKLALDTSGTGGMIAKSGDNTVPMISFPKGTVIADYGQSVHWLTIDPGEELVPFTVYKDGEEICGWYAAYDAQTYMPIEHFIPSGLDSQTYLFQNADPTRSYIVLATFSTEPDGEIYAFGARFEGSVSSVGGADDTQVEYRFTAKVLEVHENRLLVEPDEKSRERSSADKIEVSISDNISWPIPQVGDLVTVVYNGELQETYPARIPSVYRVEVIEVVETVKGNLKTYYKNADGTWQVDGRNYQYCLEITGRMPNAAGISVFVYLSNIPEISFDRAWKAAGYSSNSEDYFAPEEVVLVGMITEIWSNPMLPA